MSHMEILYNKENSNMKTVAIELLFQSFTDHSKSKSSKTYQSKYSVDWIQSTLLSARPARLQKHINQNTP